jgi:hypothetical protein
MGKKLKQWSANALAIAANDAQLIESVKASGRMRDADIKAERERHDMALTQCHLNHVYRVDSAISLHTRSLDTLSGADDESTDYDDDHPDDE